MAAYRRVDDLRPPAGWLPVHRDQLRAQRSVSSVWEAFTFTLRAATKKKDGRDKTPAHTIDNELVTDGISQHRSRIRYLSKKIANFNEFSEIKKFVKIRTKIR